MAASSRGSQKFTSGQHAGVLVSEEEIVQREKLGFTRWVNMYLKPRRVMVTDLFQDLADGNILAHLMEVLSGESVQTYGRMKFPAEMRIQQIANLSVVFSFMKQHVKLVSIGPQDILEGDTKRILGLIWTLIEHFAVIMINAHLQTDIRSYSELKETLLVWARSKVSNSRYRLEIQNFTDSLSDGKVFLALLNDGNPKECKYNPSSRKSTNLSQAFNTAEKVYGLVPMMDPNDPHATQCEQVSIIYMASLYLALPSEYDTLVTRVQIYLGMMKWWRRVKPAVHLRKVLSRARIACWIHKQFARSRERKERQQLVGIKEQWVAQKDEIATLKAQLEKMKQMYAEVGKKAGALPEVMGKFSELQSYAKSLKAEYERRISELEDHIDRMAAEDYGDKDSMQRKMQDMETEIKELRSELSRVRIELTELSSKHTSLTLDHSQCDGVAMRLQSTVDQQANRIEELESQLSEMEDLREKNRILTNEMRNHHGTLAENEEQLEEMEEHVENLSAAMVTSEAECRRLNEALALCEEDRSDLEEKLKDLSELNEDNEKELAETRDELTELLRKYEAASDEIREMQLDNGDMKASLDSIEEVNEELTNAVSRLTEEKKSLEATRESLKDAIEDMQASAKTGIENVDQALVDLGRDFDRTRAKLGQLRTSFDGRSVIDDVVCLQHVAKLLSEELENHHHTHKETNEELHNWRTKHASKADEHAELARAHADVTQTKEQLLSRNEELEGEFEGLRKSVEETEFALAEATSKWMHLEAERTFFGNTARKINRHAIASLKSGQLAGILVSSVNLALDDLPNVKAEAIKAGLGSSFIPSNSACSFLDAPEDPSEKGEIIWSEELIQMVCTEIDGLRRTIREREVTLSDKNREITSLEAARREITEMRNETEAARDAFYEHKEAWERSITAELTAQVTALREQVASYDDDNRKARRSVSELSMGKEEQEAALERLRLAAKSREMELQDQIKSLTQKHSTEISRLKADLHAAETTLQEQLNLLDKTRSSSLHASTMLEEHEAELRGKDRNISRLEEMVAELEARLEESEQIATRARALAREKADLEGQLRALSAEHDNLRNQFRGKINDHESIVSREQEKEVALETAASRYMQQQTLLDELFSRAEELAKHAQDSLVKMNQLKSGGDDAAVEGLDREAQIYRSELDANIDLNPALAELMFTRFIMHKLEAQIFALREDDDFKRDGFVKALEEVSSNKAEMDELMDHQQGVKLKMKSLQEKSYEISESLKEKESALQEANAAIDELESKLERTLHQLDLERKAATATKLERDDLEATLEAAQAEFDAEVDRLTHLGHSNDSEGGRGGGDVGVLKRKLEEKERSIKEAQSRLREAENRNRELTDEVNHGEEMLAELRASLEAHKSHSDSNGMREQMIILENEKERAEQDVAELNEAMTRLENDTRNPRLLSVRRAGQMQHLMYEIEDLEIRQDLDMEENARLRSLHEELFNIFEDTLCYLKGGMIQLTTAEMKKIEQTLSKCKDPRQCTNIFKEAHLSCKKIIVSVAPSNTSMANSHWTIPNMQALDQVPENKYMELLKNIRNLLVAHDMMDVESRSKLSTFVEIMINLDWLVILGHKAMDVEAARRNKAERRAYGTGGSGGPSMRERGGGGGDQDSYGGGRSGPGSDNGSVGSRGQMSYKRNTSFRPRGDGY